VPVRGGPVLLPCVAMGRSQPLPFDPIEEAARQWAARWDGVEEMRAVTSLMRTQQLVLGELDELLKPHRLTFARYEALVLLTFSRKGSLPLGKMGSRLQVHPTSVTSIVDRLERDGLVRRRPHPEDRRTVLAEITDTGRELVRRATDDLVGAHFGLRALNAAQLRQLTQLLRPVRREAGDFVVDS
jgi:DNA-binding MarR family transcriptional regulator